MDFTSLKEQVTNLTLYDLKAGVRKVQNGIFLPQKAPTNSVWSPISRSSRNELLIVFFFPAVMNYTEMEAKVCWPPIAV